MKEALLSELCRPLSFLFGFQLFSVILNTFNLTRLVEFNSLPWKYINSVFLALPQVSKISTYLMLCNFADMVFWALARKWKFGSYLSQGHSNAYFSSCICKPTLPRRESKNSRLANTNFLSYLQPHFLYSASLIFSGEKKDKEENFRCWWNLYYF